MVFEKHTDTTGNNNHDGDDDVAYVLDCLSSIDPIDLQKLKLYLISTSATFKHGNMNGGDDTDDIRSWPRYPPGLNVEPKETRRWPERPPGLEDSKHHMPWRRWVDTVQSKKPENECATYKTVNAVDNPDKQRCCAVIMDKSLSKVLIVHEYVENNMGKWGFPKGKVQQGESLERCAFREACEEINLELDVTPHEMLYKYFVVIPGWDIKDRFGNPVKHGFNLIRLLVDIDTLDLKQGREIDDFKWVSFDELMDMVKKSPTRKGRLLNQMSIEVAHQIKLWMDRNKSRYSVDDS